MTTIHEILAAIPKLTLEERAKVAAALHGWEDDDWDRQMKADADAGKFDEIIAEIEDDLVHGRLREFP